MIELLGAIALVVIILAGAYLRGKQRKLSNFDLILAEPERVSRLYLRHAQEINAYWLHAELSTGKKLRLAAPWDLDAALARLAPTGLALDSEDRDRLQNLKREQARQAQACTRPASKTKGLIAA